MKILYEGATIIDGERDEPIENGGVVVEDESIQEVGPLEEITADADEVENMSGKTIMPGLINMHDHLVFKEAIGHPLDFLEEKGEKDIFVFALRTTLDLLSRGFTTVRDMGTLDRCSLFIRDMVNRGELPGPDILTCNSPISCTRGHAHQVTVEVDGEDEVRRAARNQLKLGADFIKVMASDDPIETPKSEHTIPELTRKELQAAVETAHDWGLHAGCHCMGKIAIERVIDAGIDIIDHGIYLNDELAETMASEGIYLTPTFSAYSVQTLNPIFERGEEWAEAHQPLADAQPSSVRSAIDAGVKILNGTDSTGRYAEEVELFREQGMGPMESLFTCGKYPAEALGLEDKIGTIAPGKVADLVILNENPIDDPYAMEDVDTVIKGGKAYRPDEIVLTSENPLAASHDS